MSCSDPKEYLARREIPQLFEGQNTLTTSMTEINKQSVSVTYGWSRACECSIRIGDSMESDESYLTALRETAYALVEEAMRNAQESLRNECISPNEETDQDYRIKNIKWIRCQDFSVELGVKQIEKYISTWEFHESWLHCTDFLKEEDLEFSKLFHYRTRWSIPTRRKPVPRATACVYFTIQISKIKPDTLPVEVFFIFESTRLVHRPGKTRFREKWLKDIIESKIIVMDGITF